MSSLLLSVLYFSSSLFLLSSASKLTYDAVVRQAKAQVSKGGCGVNVCFAIDTSGSVTDEQFKSQKFFIQDITAIIGVDSRAKFAACQYGDRSYTISLLTKQVGLFNRLVENASFQGDPVTAVGAGIVYCDRQLRRSRGQANKIVLIGDGRNNLGGSPVRRANIFRRKAGGAVCSVGVGFEDKATLTKIAGGEERVFAVDDYVELAFIVEDLVFDICGFRLQI